PICRTAPRAPPIARIGRRRDSSRATPHGMPMTWQVAAGRRPSRTMRPSKAAAPVAKDDPVHDERIREIKRSPSYRIAHTDADFMGRVELRPVRLQLELLKPELVMQEEHVHSTIVVFGGTRVLERGPAQARLDAAKAELAGKPEDLALQRRV